MSRQQANDKPVVMISSTARDLPEHRDKVMHACLRLGMLPKMMEHLPASPDDAIAASLKLVDEADVYVGVVAFRYGYVPDGHEKSITEMEYDRAVERGIPRLVFLMGEDHSVSPKDVEKGTAGARLDALRERLGREQVVSFFDSPDKLLADAFFSLGEIQKQLAADRLDGAGRPTGEALAASLHYVSAIPTPPEPYIAHPYTLLQVRRLVGRKKELELLTDWVTKPQFADTRIFNAVAIGGMGKSALTWTWFNDVAPQEMSPLAGRMWWSFYESDATFENFITRALAYVSRCSLAEVERESFPECERNLLAILDREPFLLALDGLERILIAYARQDAAYLQDEDDLDDRTANYVAGARGLPESAGQSFVGRHQLRKTSDVRAGQFLRKLARVRASRILVSTRLFPADLQVPMGEPSSGCAALFLKGLSDQDALELWRAYGARGSRETMLPVFRTFDSHPLLLQLLAYEVANFHDAPGDFDAWRLANPDFDPFGLPLVQVQSHVLTYALRDLSDAEQRTLHTIAGFRMPASIDTIKALLMRAHEQDDRARMPFATLAELDSSLTTLEDRGLLGWDRRANRFDLHPIVRGVVWSTLAPNARANIQDALRSHFEALTTVQLADVESLSDLTPAIELYNTLIGMERYAEAYLVFVNRLQKPTLYRLSAGRLRVELLQRLFPHGQDVAPALSQPLVQSYIFVALAQGYLLIGRPGLATNYARMATEISGQEGTESRHLISLGNLVDALRISGEIRAVETTGKNALILSRKLDDKFGEAMVLLNIGWGLSARGVAHSALVALRRSLSIQKSLSNKQMQSVVNAHLSEHALWLGDAVTALTFAGRAWELAAARHFERDFIHAACLQGKVALQLGDFDTAYERLHHALERARNVNYVEVELPALVTLAEFHQQRGEAPQARELLENVWEPAECGPYPLCHADALNVLSQIERDAGNTDAAVQAATEAYQKAWCDGPPFTYHWGLEKARQHLAALGAPEPEMPPFDESKYEPMPEVEIDPDDEFSDPDDEYGEQT